MTLGIHGYIPAGRALKRSWREAGRLDYINRRRRTALPGQRFCPATGVGGDRRRSFNSTIYARRFYLHGRA